MSIALSGNHEEFLSRRDKIPGFYQSVASKTLLSINKPDCLYWITLLSDFINLTQVHNFTVSAQDIFTFRRLSVFTVSFTGILQLLMQIMKRFVPAY